MGCLWELRSTRGGEEWVVRHTGFWGVSEDAESPLSEAGMRHGSWQVSAGALRFRAGRGASARQSSVVHLGPRNEELQPWATSNPAIQPGLYRRRQRGCAQAVLQGEVTRGCTQPALREWEVTAGCSEPVPHSGVAQGWV